MVVFNERKSPGELIFFLLNGTDLLDVNAFLAIFHWKVGMSYFYLYFLSWVDTAIWKKKYKKSNALLKILGKRFCTCWVID